MVIASLIATFRDFDLAEEAFADAVEAALLRWEKEGVPDRPAAWLTTVARRRALDRLRHGRVITDKASELRVVELERRGEIDEVAMHDLEDVPDERLRLIFTCCHPALSLEARVALTLRSLGGLSNHEVAHAFLVSESAMARRLVRAKKKIREAGIPYRVPDRDQLAERIGGVLAVVYLIFNQGYGSAKADDARRELCAEAIRLTRILTELLPNDPEVLGLLALTLLHDARRDARLGPDGEMIPLELQNPDRFRPQSIREGRAALERARALDVPGPYQLQAAISAVHIEANDRGIAAEERWNAVASLYAELESHLPTPVVALNHAVAIALSGDVASGLRKLDSIARDSRVAGHFDAYAPYHAARADLLRRNGQHDAAREAYRRAIELTDEGPERRFLQQKLEAELH